MSVTSLVLVSRFVLGVSVAALVFTVVFVVVVVVAVFVVVVVAAVVVVVVFAVFVLPSPGETSPFLFSNPVSLIVHLR